MSPFGLNPFRVSPFDAGGGGGGGGDKTFIQKFMTGREGFAVDFSDISTLYQDADKTIPVTEVGQEVRGIDDVSGNNHIIKNTGGYTYGADETHGWLISDGTGTITVDGTPITGNSINFVLVWKKTSLVSNHPSRYATLYKTQNGAHTAYYDQNNGGKMLIKSTRDPVSDSRAEYKDLDYYMPIDETYLTLTQTNAIDSDIRINGWQRATALNTGTSFVDEDDSYELIKSYPCNVFAFAGFSGVMNNAETLAIEEYYGNTYAVDMPNVVPQIAHRGMKLCGGEGTLPAFAYAADHGVLLWEGDLQPSADGTIHVFHDTSVDTMTDGTGIFTTLTDVEIAALSVNGSGDPPPTLESFLNLADTEGAERLYLEIKQLGEGGNDTIDDIVAMLVATGWDSKTNLSSFDYNNLTYVRSIHSTIEIGYIGDSSDNYESTLALAKADGNAALIWDRTKFPSMEANITAAHSTDGGAARINVYAWTVNQLTQSTGAWALADAGVDGILVDFPLYTYRSTSCPLSEEPAVPVIIDYVTYASDTGSNAEFSFDLSGQTAGWYLFATCSNIADPSTIGVGLSGNGTGVIAARTPTYTAGEVSSIAWLVYYSDTPSATEKFAINRLNGVSSYSHFVAIYKIDDFDFDGITATTIPTEGAENAVSLSVNQGDVLVGLSFMTIDSFSSPADDGVGIYPRTSPAFTEADVAPVLIEDSGYGNVRSSSPFDADETVEAYYDNGSATGLDLTEAAFAWKIPAAARPNIPTDLLTLGDIGSSKSTSSYNMKCNMYSMGNDDRELLSVGARFLQYGAVSLFVARIDELGEILEIIEQDGTTAPIYGQYYTTVTPSAPITLESGMRYAIGFKFNELDNLTIYTGVTDTPIDAHLTKDGVGVALNELDVPLGVGDNINYDSSTAFGLVVAHREIAT